MNWFYENSDDLWYGDLATREEAIEEGRNNHDDGRPFQIAKGSYAAPWDQLFSDWQSLATFIDDNNEDQSFEECFTEEANLGKADLEPLWNEINAVWRAFVDSHKPVSRLLNFSVREDVPGTKEWIAENEPEPAQ